MHCPECHGLNTDTATACATCGLLLIGLRAQQRRKDDRAVEKRRAADKRSTCPFCRGDIAPDAVYCPHCQQILNEEHRLKVTRRMRANINYASWVAYIFGLVTFLLFRPVGMISIAAGMILSIVYYALPEAERMPRTDKKGLAAVWPFLKTQFRMDRIAVPVPALNKRRIVFVGTPLIAALIGYLANFFFLQQPMNQVLKAAAFDGIEVSTHYRYWVIPGEIIYNLQAVGAKRTIDVHTVLLEYAKRLKDHRFKNVELQFRGQPKYKIQGTAFRKVGTEYDRRNFAYVLFEFPRQVHGTPESAEGGLSDSDALHEFHKQWYADELGGTRFQEQRASAR
jgi:predicted nucleic acid-binding Zn ribbon protein